MSNYWFFGVFLVALYIGVLWVTLEIKRSTELNAKVARESIDVLSKELKEMRQVLLEIRDVEFEVEGKRVRNTKLLPHYNPSVQTGEEPFARLNRVEDELKNIS
jgi:hypothetical protein